jgi:hypothetical protein
MKRPVLVLAALIACSPLCAENTIGVAVGATGSWMTGDAFQEFQDYLVDYWYSAGPYYAAPSGELGFGLACGVIASIDVGPRTAIQPEIWYAQICPRMDVEFDGYTTVHKYTWTYRVIEVPVLLKGRFPLRARGSFGRYRTEAGAYIGPAAMVLFPPAEIAVEDDYGSNSGDWFSESDYNRLALAAIAGGEVRMYFARLYVGFDLRLSWMLTSFDDMGPGYFNDTLTPYIRFSTQVGMRL